MESGQCTAQWWIWDWCCAEQRIPAFNEYGYSFSTGNWEISGSAEPAAYHSGSSGSQFYEYHAPGEGKWRNTGRLCDYCKRADRRKRKTWTKLLFSRGYRDLFKHPAPSEGNCNEWTDKSYFHGSCGSMWNDRRGFRSDTRNQMGEWHLYWRQEGQWDSDWGFHQYGKRKRGICGGRHRI